MIKKYVYGHPFSTEATVEEFVACHEELPYFETEGEGSFVLKLAEKKSKTHIGSLSRGD